MLEGLFLYEGDEIMNDTVPVYTMFLMKFILEYITCGNNHPSVMHCSVNLARMNKRIHAL